MPNAEPQGCLAAILKIFGISLASTSPKSDQLPYRLSNNFLSPAELSFYRVLMMAIAETYVVCPKVNLADIFFVPRKKGVRSHENKINRKHDDFLLCDASTMTPVLGIELDDWSHARPDRQERDQFVDQVFEVAGLPLLHVRAAASYNPQAISNVVREAVASKVVSKSKFFGDGVPLCPK